MEVLVLKAQLSTLGLVCLGLAIGLAMVSIMLGHALALVDKYRDRLRQIGDFDDERLGQ